MKETWFKEAMFVQICNYCGKWKRLHPYKIDFYKRLQLQL